MNQIIECDSFVYQSEQRTRQQMILDHLKKHKNEKFIESLVKSDHQENEEIREFAKQKDQISIWKMQH